MMRSFLEAKAFGYVDALCLGSKAEGALIERLLNKQRVTKPKLGIRFSWKSAWCGVHYSPFNKRVCINFVPFVTVYYVYKGGLLP
jgi:hypothetical protein